MLSAVVTTFYVTSSDLIITESLLHLTNHSLFPSPAAGNHHSVSRFYKFNFAVAQPLSCVRLSVTHGLQHTGLSCPSLRPGVCSKSRPPSSHPVTPFSSCPQSFPARGSFLRSRFFASGGQSIGALASASGLSVNIQG